MKALYFARFPDGRDREAAGGVAYFRVRPTWARYSDFRGAEPVVVTFASRGERRRSRMTGVKRHGTYSSGPMSGKASRS